MPAFFCALNSASLFKRSSDASTLTFFLGVACPEAGLPVAMRRSSWAW